MIDTILEQLRKSDPASDITELASELGRGFPDEVLVDFLGSGVGFTSSMPDLTRQWYRTVAALLSCVIRSPRGTPMLSEGGPYHGSWLESTSSISSEILTRFCPATARSTLDLHSEFQDSEGLIAYKVTPQGPAYRQIQMVTPLARTLWNHYALTGGDRDFLEDAYATVCAADGWLARYRDTRGTGAVEAFSTFDTGHDLSPRFWHTPDSCYHEDARRCDPDSPVLPYIAPDLTANLACQRSCLARMAEELGRPESEVDGWRKRAAVSEAALRRECWDEADAFYYDRDRNGNLVRVQSDVLLRVYASEIGTDEEFAGALGRYLLNTSKFFARFPLTSIAMDDPRYDPHQEYNSWGGTTNFLSLVRTPHAFEHHGRHVELTWILQPILGALARATRYSQNLHPWTGAEGYAGLYTPAMLCLLDFTERLSGILPRPEGSVWFTALTPAMVHGAPASGVATGYTRLIDGRRYELVVGAPGPDGSGSAVILCDGEEIASFPRGTRLILERDGKLRGLVGMVPREVRGSVVFDGTSFDIAARGNEVLAFDSAGTTTVQTTGETTGVVSPGYR